MRLIISLPEQDHALARIAGRAMYYVLLSVGIFAMAYAGYAYLDGYWYQHTEMREFEAAAGTLAIPEAPPSAVPAAEAATSAFDPTPKTAAETQRIVAVKGDALAEILIPRLKLKAVVVEGDSSSLLRRAVGHLPDTALPGEPGNVVLAGHRDSFFRPLKGIESGDSILLQTRRGKIEYRVEWLAVVPDTAVQFIAPTNDPALTLVTCYPFSYIGAAPKRFIVRARQVADFPQSAPGNAPASN